MKLSEVEKQNILIEYQRLVDKMSELEKNAMNLKMKKKSIYFPIFLKNTDEKYTQ
jgi:hypothetical protein